MTRPDQPDGGNPQREPAKSVAIEFSNSPPEFQWAESTPSQEVETKTTDMAVHVNAVLAVESRSTAPTRIAGRYQVINELGSGGQATVYLAEDTILRRKVAIKVSKPDRALSQNQQAQFKQEAQAIASLKHPGIVTVHDFGIDTDGRCYIVLEYLPGLSLRECLKDPEKRKTFTIERTLDLVSQVAEALHYAHQSGIYHRDLKPGNILLDEHGNPHITDFGLAVTEETQRGLEGQVAGTVPYMAPEQVRGEANWLNGQADIWALGVILYEMLAGRRPFQGATEADVKKEILRRTPTPVRQLNARVSTKLESAIGRCLEKDVSKRCSTAEDIRVQLRNNFESSGSKRTFFASLVGAVLLIGVMLLSGTYYLLSKGHSSPPRNLSVGSTVALLDRPPTKLMWAAGDPSGSCEYDPTTQELEIKSKWAGLFQLESLSTPNFDFSAEIREAVWKYNSSIGVFVGYGVEPGRKDQNYHRFQAFIVASNGGRKFTVDRTYIVRNATEQRTFESEEIFLSAPFTPENLEWLKLQISVRNRKVDAVYLNGSKLGILSNKQEVLPIAAILTPDDDLTVDGGLGLLVGSHGSGMTGEFRNAKLVIVP